jgi:superfamily II DNA helicase RecQ
VWHHAQAPPRSPDPMETDDAEPFGLQPVEVALLEFCIELIRQKIRNDEYGCALICATAVLGYNESGWATPASFPPQISSILKIVRFFILHKALRLDPRSLEIRQGFVNRGGPRWMTGDMIELEDYAYEAEDEGYVSAGASSMPVSIGSSPASSSRFGQLTQEQARHPTRTFPEWVKYLVDMFMVRGTSGPIQWLIDLRTYGRTVFTNTPVEGQIEWKSGDELLYKQIHFTMGDFRGFVHGLVGKTRRILVEQLMFCPPATAPVIPWDHLYDDASQGASGWNFIQDTRTQWPVDGPEWLIERVCRERPLRRQFITSEGRGFHMGGIDQYFRVVRQFRELLSVAIHVCAGQPSRAPELLSIRHRNSERERRNVFIDDGMVMFVSRYHKGFHINNDTKVICRYLPRELGELVVWYLWLVLPFVEAMQSYQRGFRGQPASTERRGDYIWSPDPENQKEWSSPRFREILKEQTRTGLHGTSINIQAYRDIAIAISRRYLRSSSQFRANSEGDEEAGIPDIDDEDELDEDGIRARVADLQAGHLPSTAGMMYGRLMTELSNSTIRHRQMFRQSSQDWHEFLKFGSILEPKSKPVAIGPQKVQPWEQGIAEAQIQRRYDISRVDMSEAFQHMMGDTNTRLRGMQPSVLRSIQHGESPIVAVMPTGGGKSLLFMLPAWVSRGGLTIVVLPLVALRWDMQRRCQELGIPCAAWDRQLPPDGASIVLVTPESVPSHEFRRFMERQRTLKRLDRIVIDECHMVLSQDREFRPLMKELGQLRSAQTQMICLTATLPPSEEPEFCRRMIWTEGDVTWHRGRSHRPNVAYRVHTVAPPAQFDDQSQWVDMPEVIAFIQDRIRRAQPGRVIVYGTTVAHITRMAESLQCAAYHKKTIDRDGVLQSFRDTPGGVITATNALGMGIDIPDIRSVIHLGQPRTMLDYAQESGRAGRDGQSSEAIIIQAEGRRVGREHRPHWMKDHRADEHARVVEYMESAVQGCRRVVLDGYLDGEIDGYYRQRCGDADAESLCDGCEPEWQDQECMAEGDMDINGSSEASPVNGAGIAVRCAAPAMFWDGHGITNGGSMAVVHPSRAVLRDHDVSANGQSMRVRSPSPKGFDGDHDDMNTHRPSHSRVHREVSSGSELRQNSPSVMRGCVERSTGPIAAGSKRAYEPEPEHEPRHRPKLPDSSTSQAAPAPTGTKAGRVPIAERHRIRQQDIKRARLDDRHDGTASQRFQDEEFLVQELERWFHRCWTCTQAGRDDRHEMFRCWGWEQEYEALVQTNKRWMHKIRREIRYSAFTTHYHCGMPQHICPRADGRIEHSAAVQERCQGFRTALIPTIAMMVKGPYANPAISQRWFQRVAAQGVPDGRYDDTGLIGFLGQMAGGTARKRAQITEEFIWLRRAYGGYERSG